MKEDNLLEVRQRVELHIATESGILNLSTHIEHINDDDRFIVAAPFYKGRMYPFLAREHVEVLSVVEDVGVVSCEAVVEKRLRNGNIVFLSLERITEITKNQRRRHYRLPTLLDSEIAMSNRVREKRVHAVVKDISAGGVRCVTPIRLNSSEGVHLKVNLNGEILDLNSKVVDCTEMMSDIDKFETRFEFENVQQRQERAIVAYIFDEQRKRRKK